MIPGKTTGPKVGGGGQGQWSWKERLLLKGLKGAIHHCGSRPLIPWGALRMGVCTLELLKLVGFIFPLILCPSLAEGNVWGFNSSPLLAPHVGCASCQGQERAPVFEVLGHLWGGEASAQGLWAGTARGGACEWWGSGGEHPCLLSSAFQRFNGVESAPSRPSILMN